MGNGPRFVFGKDVDISDVSVLGELAKIMLATGNDEISLSKCINDMTPEELSSSLDLQLKAGTLHEVSFSIGKGELSLREIVKEREIMQSFDPRMAEIIEMYSFIVSAS